MAGVSATSWDEFRRWAQGFFGKAANYDAALLACRDVVAGWPVQHVDADGTAVPPWEVRLGLLRPRLRETSLFGISVGRWLSLIPGGCALGYAKLGSEKGQLV